MECSGRLSPSGSSPEVLSLPLFIDCQLVATHRAETEKFEENDTYAQKICSEHAEKLEGLEGVVEIWKV